LYNNKTTFNKTNLVLELKKNDINEEEEHYFETDYYYKIDQNLEDESIATATTNKQLNDLEIELEQDASLNKAALDNIEHNSPILERELLTTEHELENIKSRLEMNETVSAVTQSVLDSIRSEYNLPESKDDEEEEEELHPNSSSNEEYNDYREEKEQEQIIINEEEEEIVLDAESIKQAEKCMMIHQLDENEEIEVEEVEEEENVDKSLLYSSSAAENEDFKDSNLIKIENLQTHRKLSISQTNLIENSESDLETKPGVSILVDEEENDTQQMINSLTKTTQYQTFESSSSTNSDLYKQEDFHDDSDSKKLNKQIEKKSDDDDDDDNNDDDHGFNRSHQRSSRVKRKSKSSSTRNSPKENIDPINTISESTKISIQNQEISYSSGEVSSKSVDDLIKIDKTYLNNETNNQTEKIQQQKQQQETNMLNVTKTGITGSESREFLLQDEDNDEESSSLNTSNLTVMQTINPVMEEEEKIKQNEFSSEMSASEDERNIKSDLAIETVNLIYSSDGSSEPETSATASNNLVSSDLITLVQAAAADTVSKVYLTLDENNQNENNNNISTEDINLKGLRHASTDCSNCSLISSNIGSQNEVNLIQNEEIRSSIESMNDNEQEILNSNISKSLNYLESLVFSSNNAIITEQEKDNNILTDDIIKLSKHIEDIIDDDLSIIKSSKSLTFNRPASFKTHENENELFSKQRSDQFEQEQQTPTPVENLAGDFFDKRITSSNEPSIDYLVNLTVQHDDDEVIQQEIDDDNNNDDQEEVAAAVATALLFSSQVVSTDEFENQNYEQTETEEDEKCIKDATPRQFTKYIVLGSDQTTKPPEQEETSSFIESEEKDEEYMAQQTSTTGIENPCFIDSNNEETLKLKSNSSSISTSNESMIVNQEYDDSQEQLNIKMKINTDIILNEIKNTEQFRSEINDLIEKAEEEQIKPLILDNINDEVEEEEGVVIDTQKNEQNLIDEQTFLMATPTPSNQSPLVDKNVNFITSATEQMDKAVELVEQTLNKSIEFIQQIKVETPQNSPESKTNENSSNSSSSSNTFDNIFEKALDQMSHESSDKEAKIQADAQLIVDQVVLKAITSNSDQVDTILNESIVFNTEADSQLLAKEIEILVKEDETKTSNELVSDSQLIVENAEQLVKDEEETKTSNELVSDSQLLVDDCIAKAIEINSKELQLDSKILVENVVAKALEINSETLIKENEEENKTTDEIASDSQLLVENADVKALEIDSETLVNAEETKTTDELVSDSQLLVDDCIAKAIEINSEQLLKEDVEEAKTSNELVSDSKLLVDAEELAVEAKVLIDNVLEKALKTVKIELSDDDGEEEEEEDDDKKKKKKKHDDNEKDKNIFKKKDDDDDDDNDDNTKRPDSGTNEAYSSELVSTETTNLQVTEQNKDEHLEETEDLTTVLVQPDEQNIVVVQEVEENNPLLTSSFMSSNGNLPKELNTTDLENSFDLCDNLTIYNSVTTDDDNSDDFEDEDRFSNKTLNLDVTNPSQSVTPNNLKSSASSTTSSYHTAYTTAAAASTNSEIINTKKQQYINSKELRSSGGSATQTISSSNYMTAVDEMTSLKKSNSQNLTSSESFYSVSDTSFKSDSRKNSINNNNNTSKKHNNKSIDTSFSSSTYSGNGLANLSSLESSYSDSNENNDLLTPNLTLESDDDTDLDADLVSFGNEQIQSAESKQFGNFNVEYFLKNMYPLNNNFQSNNESNKTIESSSHNSTLTDDEEQKQNKTKENFTFIHKEDLPDLGSCSSSKLISDDNEFIITEPDIKIEPQITDLEEEDKIEIKLNKTDSPQLLLSSPVYEKKIIITNSEGGVSSNAGSSASGSGDNVSYTSSVLEFENLEMQYTIEQFDQDNNNSSSNNNNNNNNEDSILVYNYDENLKNNNYDMMISHDLNTIYESSSVDENESIPEVNPKSPDLINDSSNNNNTKKMNNQNLSLNFFQIETSKAYEKPINVTFNKVSTSLNNSPLGSPSLLKSMNRMSQTPDRESSSSAFLISKTNTSRSSSSSSIKSTDSFENELKCKFKIDENSYFAKKQLEKKNLVKLEEIIVDSPQQQLLTTTKTNDSIDSAITNNARSTDSGQSSMNDILNMANQLTSPESENNSFLNRLNNDSFSSPLSSLTTSYMSDLGALANIVSPTSNTSQNDESFKQQQSSATTSTVFNAEDLPSFRKMSSPISFNSINEKSFATKPVHLIPTSSSASNIDQKLFNFNSNTNTTTTTTTIITTTTNTSGGAVVASSSSSSSSASNSNETKLKKTNNSNPNLSNSHHSSSSLSSSHHSSNCYCGKQKTTSDYTISTSTTQPVIQLTNKQEGNI